MKRLAHAKPETVVFRWNGHEIEGRAGDSIAAALYAAGIRTLVRSRKYHQPRGLSGSFIGTVLARVDGRPNVRLDLEIIRPGLDVRIQNVWPSAETDLLSLARLLPTRWLYAGFEHSSRVPDRSPIYAMWESCLSNLAGMADPPDRDLPSGRIPGQIISTDVAVIGGGPAGCEIANRTVAAGSRVVLITRGARLGRFSQWMTGLEPVIDPRVQVFTEMEAFGLYRRGTLLACAPHRHDQPAVIIASKQTVLATGLRSCPPLVPGNALPGVLDAHVALELAQTYAVAPGRDVFVVGTGSEDQLAARLGNFGINVIGTAPVARLRRIIGRDQVAGMETDQRFECDCVIHAGPWRNDPNLFFQGSATGLLQLALGKEPREITVSGSAVQRPESVVVGSEPDGLAFVCPCMDVTWGEVAYHCERGHHDLEVLKRLTACGMGPCQGTPCWDLMAAALAGVTGALPESLGSPSFRDPRRAITVAQAAGLDGLVEPDR